MNHGPVNFESVNSLSETEAKSILNQLFLEFSKPAFGAIPKREIDLLIYRMMYKAGVIASDASQYDIMIGLRITKSKVRNLEFERCVRHDQNNQELDKQLRSLLCDSAGFAIDGNYVAISTENPLLQAHLKEKLRLLRHLSDASFDPSIVRLKPDALSELICSLADDDRKKELIAKLQKEGVIEDTSLSGIISSALKHQMARLAGDAAGKAVGNLVSNILGDAFKTAGQQIFDLISHAGKTNTTSA